MLTLKISTKIKIFLLFFYIYTHIIFHTGMKVVILGLSWGQDLASMIFVDPFQFWICHETTWRVAWKKFKGAKLLLSLHWETSQHPHPGMLSERRLAGRMSVGKCSNLWLKHLNERLLPIVAKLYYKSCRGDHHTLTKEIRQSGSAQLWGHPQRDGLTKGQEEEVWGVWWKQALVRGSECPSCAEHRTQLCPAALEKQNHGPSKPQRDPQTLHWSTAHHATHPELCKWEEWGICVYKQAGR